MHQLGGLIEVVLNAYIHNKDGQFFGIPKVKLLLLLFPKTQVKLLCTREKPLPAYVKLPCLENGACGNRQKILHVGLSNNFFLCKRMGHLANECSLSRKAPVDVANDVPQTSVGGPWVQLGKRHIVKKMWQDTSKWQPKKDNIHNLLTDVGEGQTQLTKDLGKRQVLDHRHRGKEIVQEIKSRSGDPNFNVQTYNEDH